MSKLAISLGLAGALCACATTAERPQGAVVPLGGGKYQSSVSGMDMAMASKTFAGDAELTCRKGPPASLNPLAPKPTPGKFVMVSQTAKNKDGKEIKSDNSKLDAGIAVGLRYLGLESKDKVELVSTFTCE